MCSFFAPIDSAYVAAEIDSKLGTLILSKPRAAESAVPFLLVPLPWITKLNGTRKEKERQSRRATI